MKTNSTNRETNKKRNRLLFAGMLALIMGVTATGAIAFAARWFDQTNKTENTVTVDHPVVVSITDGASSGTIMPGVDSTAVKTTFDISISGKTENTYKLVIKDIEFAFDDALIGSIENDGYFDDKAELEAIFGVGYTDFKEIDDYGAFADFLLAFEVSFNGEAAVSLEEGLILNPDAATAKNQTVSITATDDLLLIARGGTLSFTLALEVA